MLNKSKLATIVIGLSIHSIAMAGMSGAPSCLPGNVTVPCAQTQWDLGIEALYLKSSYNANAAYSANNSATLADRYRDIDNDWGWGYRLQGSYHFNTGNDVTMSYMHYDNDAKQNGLQNDFLPIAFVQPLAQYNLELNNIFDQVNLVMGQHVDFGLIKNARFYGGLQYARIRAESSSQFTNAPFTAFSRTTFADSKGWGPVIGVDYSYDLVSGLSLTANAAGSLIYGNGRYSSSFISNGTLVVSGSYASKKVLIPSLETKLGVNYAYTAPMGSLNIEAGYQALNYFNALQTRSSTALGNINDTDFGLYGPYLGVHWVGNA